MPMSSASLDLWSPDLSRFRAKARRPPAQVRAPRAGRHCGSNGRGGRCGQRSSDPLSTKSMQSTSSPLPPPSGLGRVCPRRFRRLTPPAMFCRRFAAALLPCQHAGPWRAPASRLPEAGVMLIPQRLKPHGRPWRRAAGGSCGPVPARGRTIRPTPSAERCTGHRTAARHTERKGRLPRPLLSAGFPATIPGQAPPGESRIGQTPLGQARAPPLARAHGTRGTYGTNGTACGRRPLLLPPRSGLGRGCPRMAPVAVGQALRRLRGRSPRRGGWR